MLVSSSPIKSHPSTHIIDKVLGSIYERLPSSRVIIMQDGVRSEQQEYHDRYEEYLRRMIDNHPEAEIVIANEHKHQARMTRDVLRAVTTPYIFFVEHDMVLCEEIPFDTMKELIASGQANLVRLMFEAHILDVHRHLMLERKGDFTKTIQWSQRPHLASTEFYKRILNDYFSDHSLTYIEDRIYGVVSESPWENFKLWVYTPDGDNKRSYTIDGREDDPKWDQELVY